MSTRIAGESFHFAPPRDAGWPEAWRDLDRAVWRWVRAHGGDAATARAAAWASHADGQGHSALPLWLAGADGKPLLDADHCAALAASPLVATAATATDAPRPFVLEDDHFYLWRNHRAEVAVAQALAERRAAARAPARPLSEADLDALFQGGGRVEEERQRAAVRQAPGRRLLVLTGGPGTGKTRTVLRMLLGLSREHEANHGRLPRLQLAAPTGKAAQRLGESLREGAAALCDDPARPLAAAWRPHLEAVLAAECGTLHRMLGSRGRGGGFAHHAGEPLPADLVVLDEASMLDLGLLRALLAALREDAVLVLVGDADQLTSVGTGSVMMDLVRALEADAGADLVRLRHCFRADATLVPIHEAVRVGDAEGFEAAFDAASRHHDAHGRPTARRCTIDSPASLHRQLAAWARDLQAALAACGIAAAVAADDARGLADRLSVLRRQQLLCAQRDGPFGALRAAAGIAAQLRAWDALAGFAGQAWYPGRAVLVTRNDHAARLYNGDVGLCVLVREADGEPRLRVVFDAAPEPVVATPTAATPAATAAAAATPTAAAEVAVRLFDPGTLPPHEDAFALTVHKSQGSEYERVAVLLPPDPESPLLHRQTLYTGLSRAKAALELWSTPAATAKALRTALARHGRLAERLVAAGRRR